MPHLDLSNTFSQSDINKVFLTLQHLEKCVGNFALTGGLATAYYLARHNIPTQIRKFNDLDMVINDPQDVKPAAQDHFLISHYHPRDKKDKFHVMLVDKQTAVRIDLFPLRSTADQRYVQVNFNGKHYSLISLEDLVCRLLHNCQSVLENKTIDPKYFYTLLTLFAVCNKNLIKQIWSEYTEEKELFSDVYLSVLTKLKKQPDLLKPIVYSQDQHLVCHKCQPPDYFQLASNQEVYDLLGYV